MPKLLGPEPMGGQSGSTGRTGFIDRHALWDDDAKRQAKEVIDKVQAEGLEVIRLSFADQHGVLRGKTIVADGLGGAFRDGCAITSSLILKDTSHRTAFPVWSAGAGLGSTDLEGAGDLIMVPDPGQFRMLPWAAKTGWMLCDIYYPDGQAVPYSTRALCRAALGRLGDAGYSMLSGIEAEFHLFKLEDSKLRPDQAGWPGDAPDVSFLAHGYQYLTETRFDELEPALEILWRQLSQMGLPLRTIEAEMGPSQCEFTFHPAAGLAMPDAMVLLRSAVKQIARRHGLHATFMCRPELDNVMSSGWHLHQSLWDLRGNNLFTPKETDAVLSALGRQYVAGLLAHAPAACVFTTPTINGYKRFKPGSLAPERILWGHDNKGAMIRALGGTGDSNSRIENRVGEPTANPYLYLTSQIVSGLDGIERGLEPPSAADTPYDGDAPTLPRSLMEALEEFQADPLFRAALGDDFVDYFTTIKSYEVSRFLSAVTDWEQREYFQLF